MLQVATSKDEGCAQHDNILLVLCKAIHLTVIFLLIDSFQ
jgi:hypothetical protein